VNLSKFVGRDQLPGDEVAFDRVCEAFTVKASPSKKPFYRYIRPSMFNQQRLDFEPSAYGGVCLRFEEHDGTLWVAHARCAVNELFSKDVAKRIADARAEHLLEMKYPEQGNCGKFPMTKKTSELCSHLLAWAETWVPETKNATLLYHAFEMKELASDIRLIEFTNEQQEQLSNDWITSIEAAKFSSQYGSQYGSQDRKHR